MAKKVAPVKDIRMLVRRDPEGYVFSEIRDMNAEDRVRYLGHAVVIDRQRGRAMDSETVINRAQSLSKLLDIPYDEDLTQQCKRDMGFIGACGCPRCVAKNDARAKKTRD